MNKKTRTRNQIICDRADAIADARQPLWTLFREYDLHPSAFYIIYKTTRGVKWSDAHPRELHTGRGTNVSHLSPYIANRRYLTRDQWTGSPKQLLSYLDTLEK